MKVPQSPLENICPSSLISGEIACHIEAMHNQECNGYSCSDYLHLEQENVANKTFCRPLPLHQQWIAQPRASSKKVDAGYREKLTNWCFQVADHCDIEHETVGIAMSYLDRFLSTKSGFPVLQCRKTYQIATITCLYMAIKIFETEVIEPETFAAISRGRSTAKDITDMEMIILSALEWRVQPPTALSFTRHFLALLTSASGVGRSVINDLFVLSQLQTEIAVNDYYFVTIKPSTIAVASILNSIDGMANKDSSKSIQSLFIQTLTQLKVISPQKKEILEAQDRLLSRIAETRMKNDHGDRTQQRSSCGLASTRHIHKGSEERSREMLSLCTQ